MSTTHDVLEKNLKSMNHYHPINIDLLKKTPYPENPICEVFEPVDVTDLDIYDGLIVYGFLEGKFVESLFEWLDQKEHRRLIVCETNPSIYKQFFSQESAETIFAKKRVHLLLTPDGLNKTYQSLLDDIVSHMVKIFNLRSCKFIEHSSLKDTTGQRDLCFNDALEKAMGDFYAQDAAIKGQHHKAIVNLFENLSINKDFILSHHIKDLFKGTPIVLCGAGFSMPKIYDKLKQIQAHTLIAAAGTGGSLLTKNGIETHFNAILDIEPDKENTSLYNNHSGALFFLHRSGAQAVSKHQGIKILCNPILPDEVLEILNIQEHKSHRGPLNFWTVTDFLLIQLINLGFGPIYLCGADHILENKRYYGDDVLQSVESETLKKMYVHVKNIKNEPCISKFDWAQGSKAIGEIAKHSPETEIFYVSDKGLPIENVKVMSTDEFNKLSFDKSRCAEDIYLPPLLEAPFVHASDEKIIQRLNFILESLSKCKEIFLRIEIELGRLFSVWQLMPIDELNPYQDVFFHFQELLNKEIAYTQYLRPAWRSLKSIMHAESGFFEDHTKAKLTLFALKIRELDVYKHQSTLFHNLFTMQKYQTEERFNKFNPQASTDNSQGLDKKRDSEFEMV